MPIRIKMRTTATRIEINVGDGGWGARVGTRGRTGPRPGEEARSGIHSRGGGGSDGTALERPGWAAGGGTGPPKRSEDGLAARAWGTGG